MILKEFGLVNLSTPRVHFNLSRFERHRLDHHSGLGHVIVVTLATGFDFFNSAHHLQTLDHLPENGITKLRRRSATMI